ncbi:MAG: PilZ domain-containing protein [Myxococcota bacterium]
MNRRGSERVKRRIPCDFQYESHTYAGIVVDLSAEGLFLQTEAAIEPGVELAMRLRPERVPELALRGRVVRRRFTPAVLASMIRRGVGIRILEAPPQFYALLGVAAPDDAEQVWETVDDWGAETGAEAAHGPVAIDIQVGDGVDPVGDASTDTSWGKAVAADDEWSFSAPVAEPAAPEKPDAELDEHWEALDTDALPPPPEWAPESLCRADALLIDDGELDDVNALLEALGADPVRHRAVDTQGFTGWEQPPRVVVAAARSALRLSVGPAVEGQGIVTIAVVDTNSQVLNGMLRRQGFRYVVRRPVHPEALRLLLLRALYRGRERREAPRVPLGCEIALRLRLTRRPATLLDLSRTGCRVYTREWLEPGDRVGLRVPQEITGARPLSLAGRVVRAARRRAADPDERVALALRFDRLDASARDRLEGLIEAHTSGPPPLHLPEAESEAAAPPHPAPPVAEDAIAPVERRRAPRTAHREEVLALDPELQRVRFALFGVDLSPAGLRVEPHPELALGDRMQLALYDAACASALMLDAEVTRDDGPQGLLLRFDPLDEAGVAELARILERSPQLEASVAGDGRGLVLAEVVKSEDA